MKLDLVASGLQFPEGPIAMDDGSVVLVEIRRQTLSRAWPDGRVEVIAELGGGPNGAAIGPDGHVYVCNNGGFGWTEFPGGITSTHGTAADYETGSIQRVDLSDGSFETLYDSCDGVPLRGPNDIVFDKHGGFWFTDLGKAMEHYRHHGSIYYAWADGSRIVRAHTPMVTPNGIGLSPDGQTLYVAETMTGRLWGFEIEGRGKLKPAGPLPPRQPVVTMPGYQLFDSMAVQADGKVCVATLFRGGVSIIDPTDGAVEYHDVPDEPFVTNICFGGPDRKDAWITASGRGNLFHTRWGSEGLRLNYNA